MLKIRGREKAIFAVAIIGVGFAASYLVPRAERSVVIESKYPAQACPVFASAGSTTASLPTSQLQVRYVDGRSTSFKSTRYSQIALTKSALLINSNPGSSLIFSALASSGIAAAACSAGSPDEWFIGGSGGLTSKGQLQLVNSGLSESIVDIYPFTSKSALAQISVKVKANSSRAIALDALAPGDDSMALHVVARTGRISAFVLDQRAKGLSKLGMDYVKASGAPAKELFIPAIYPHTNSKSSILNSLRLLVPGTLDATVHVQVISGDSSFVPVGFDSLQVAHGTALTIPLTNLTTASAFGLQITADQPILAGTLTTDGSQDFAWAAPVDPLVNTSMNFAGQVPVLTFMGKSISVKVSGNYVTGKRFAQTITGTDFAMWAPKTGITSIHFQTNGGADSPVFAGALFTSGGLTTLPIERGGPLENTTLPFNDVHTLTH